MKKRILLSIFAIATVFGASAQSKAVEMFASSWDGRQGVSVVNLKANVVKMDKVGGISVSGFIKQISAITIVANEQPGEEFIREMKRVVDEGHYTEFMSVSANGERVKILYAEQSGYKDRGGVLITVSSSEKVTLISAVGELVINKE